MNNFGIGSGSGRVAANSLCVSLMAIPAIIFVISGIINFRPVLRLIDDKDQGNSRFLAIGCGCLLLFFSIGLPLLCNLAIQLLSLAP